MEFVQVDVFAEGAFEGNPLAVFPEAGNLSGAQMQAIAQEMNLSETTFVTSTQPESYDVRIFTPHDELGFAGHPTIGTAWVLDDLGVLKGEAFVQRSAAGPTRVTARGDRLWFEREGSSEPDLEKRDPDSTARVARALGLAAGDVGLEARELGRAGRLSPAFADAGLRQLMVPMKDLRTLGEARPRPDLLAELTTLGVYCFTAVQAGRLRSRGFFPGVGIAEDPATGSAAAALGLYLASRLGSIAVEVRQGVEMGRPSRIFVEAEAGRVSVGGSCHRVMSGRMDRLP